jgi:hypothetical protein
MVLPAVASCFRASVALARSFAGRWFVSPSRRSRRPPLRDRRVHDVDAPIGRGHVALTAIAIAVTTAGPIAALRWVRSAGASGLNGFQLTTVRILAVTATAGVVLGLWRAVVLFVESRLNRSSRQPPGMRPGPSRCRALQSGT